MFEFFVNGRNDAVLIEIGRASFDATAATGAEEMLFLVISSDKFVVIPIVEAIDVFRSKIKMISNLRKAFGEASIPV